MDGTVLYDCDDACAGYAACECQYPHVLLDEFSRDGGGAARLRNPAGAGAQKQVDPAGPVYGGGTVLTLFYRVCLRAAVSVSAGRIAAAGEQVMAQRICLWRPPCGGACGLDGGVRIFPLRQDRQRRSGDQKAHRQGTAVLSVPDGYAV